MKTMSFILMVFLLSTLQWANPAASPAPAEKIVPDYSNSTRQEVPDEYKWKIQDIFTSPQAWEQEKEHYKKLVEGLAEVHRGWLDTPQKFLAFNQYISKLIISGSRLYDYASLQLDMEMDNGLYSRMIGELEALARQVNSVTASDNQDILALGEEKFNEFLKVEPGIKPYAREIKWIFENKVHMLSPDVSEILNRLDVFMDVPESASRALLDVELPAPAVTLADGKTYTLTYPTFHMLNSTKNPADRQLLYDTYYGNLYKFRNTFAILFNGVVEKNEFNAGMRKFNNALELRMWADNLDPAFFHTIISQVRGHLGIFHRYLRLKKELLGINPLKLSDAFISPVTGVEKRYSFDEARQMTLAAVKPLGEDYVTGFSTAFSRGWLDIYPHKSKRKFGYSRNVYGVHPFVLLNFTGDIQDVIVMVHELGHGMNSWLTDRHQPFKEEVRAGMGAETAAQLNELLLITFLQESRADDLFKLYTLDKFVKRIVNAIFNQVRYAEFEHAMHLEVEAGNVLTADWLDDKFLELTRYYYGEKEGICRVNSCLRSSWMDIPHFFMNYYFISYADGMMAALAFHDMITKGGEEARARYIHFLCSGSSDSILNLLKQAGVDMSSEKTYDAAFDSLERLIVEMEKTSARLKKAGRLQKSCLSPIS